VSAPLRPLVAIGIGNIMSADDAIGVRVIEGLRGLAVDDPQAVPPATRLVDGGTLGMDLLKVVGEARGVVLVDAVRLGGPVGHVSVMDGDAIVSVGGTSHGSPATQVGELLAVARLMGWLPAPVSMVGIEVADLDFGMRLTPAVDEAIPAAMDAVLAELRRMDELPIIGLQGGAATGRTAGATA
jgi:hydrogenase maturation protease